MLGGGFHDALPGQYTDDTLQALALAETLIRCQRLDVDDFVGRLIQVYRAHPEFFGPTSRTVLDLIEDGLDPGAAATRAHETRGGSRSNGSVMRGIPVGVFYPPGEVREMSLAASRITHLDPAAGEASAIINRMVSGMCRGEGVDEAFGAAVAACRDAELKRCLKITGLYPPEPSLARLCPLRDRDPSRRHPSVTLSCGGQRSDADTGAITGGLARQLGSQRSGPGSGAPGSGETLVALEDSGQWQTVGGRRRHQRVSSAAGADPLTGVQGVPRISPTTWLSPR